MNIRRDDLKRLRAPIALAAALAAVGIAVLVASQSSLDTARRAREASRASRVGAQERVLRVSEEEREIRENLIDYERMREHGMLSDQNRIEWIESIARIKNARKLFEIRYRIEAQRTLDYPGIVPTGGADLVVSRMKLDMLLLHEDDLLNFLADLQAAKKAYVSVRQCMITRLERGTVQNTPSLQPRLQAECQVDLVSVRGIRPGGKSNA
ncbi:MAG TPA: hypothetical protein VJO54_12930, partial [Burkholderiales bacterium]|nr:hypothetical protein [Burkholderiales bacterium]